MDCFTLNSSALPVTGLGLTAGCEHDQLHPSVTGVVIPSTQSFNDFTFDFSSSQLQQYLCEETSAQLSREFFQATDSNHPLNLPNNVTGDDGLVYTEELLELHQYLWSLSDEEVISYLGRMHEVDNAEWKVWVRRSMACVGAPIPTDTSENCYNDIQQPLGLMACDNVPDNTPYDLDESLDCHDYMNIDTLLNTNTPLADQNSFPYSADSSTPVDTGMICDGYGHRYELNDANTLLHQAVSPSNLVASDVSTPSTTFESFGPPESKNELVRRIPSPPPHATLGYHDTGAGAGYGIFFPFVEENPATSPESTEIEQRSAEAGNCINTKLPKHIRDTVPPNMMFTWRASAPTDFIETDTTNFAQPPSKLSVGPIRSVKIKARKQRVPQAHSPMAFTTDDDEFDSDSSSGSDYNPIFPHPFVCQWSKTSDGKPVNCSYVFSTTNTSSPNFHKLFLAELETHMKEDHLPAYRSDMETDARGRVACQWKGCTTKGVMYPSLLKHLLTQHSLYKYKCERCGIMVRKGNDMSRHRQPSSTGASKCDIQQMVLKGLHREVGSK
ncbi:hypothetical protein V5O48_006045 [Marasmius crinis-equi]|uniref:C2H2-type domain-containing protein n=1 Tax=Marasmius crinis-equi TaxID=585013 RepID=A0ABR3FKK9_9AGAR